MPNLCGVNQKILNELLDTVKRSNLINKKAPTPKMTIPENSAEDIYSSVYDVLGSDLLRLSIADITSSSSDSESVKNSNVDKNTTLEPWSVHRSGIRSRPQSRIVLETSVADYDNLRQPDTSEPFNTRENVDEEVQNWRLPFHKSSGKRKLRKGGDPSFDFPFNSFNFQFQTYSV